MFFNPKMLGSIHLTLREAFTFLFGEFVFCIYLSSVQFSKNNHGGPN